MAEEVRYEEPVLCYVAGCWAYFTTRQLDPVGRTSVVRGEDAE